MKIVHRDLKPENILLVSKNQKIFSLKLADFGFAKKLRHNKKETRRCGSPYYMAPELVSGKPYDFKADIWSIGVITYLLLSGKPPFEGET